MRTDGDHLAIRCARNSLGNVGVVEFGDNAKIRIRIDGFDCKYRGDDCGIPRSVRIKNNDRLRTRNIHSFQIRRVCRVTSARDDFHFSHRASPEQDVLRPQYLLLRQ